MDFSKYCRLSSGWESNSFVVWICRSGNMDVNLCNPHFSTQLLVVLRQESSGQVQVEQREESLTKKL
jgi:hypothetical protein